MPWPGERGGDGGADDDPVADGGTSRTPPPPDDRLWRHPSEVAWATPAPAASRPTRVWTIALTSGLTGAVLALGVVALVSDLGRTERVVERVPVRDAATTGVEARARRDGVPGVAGAVSPSVVRLDVATPAGTVTGSGVVFRDDGTILTNAHVVEGGGDLTVVLADGTGVPATVAGVDEYTDVAVVVVDESHRGGTTWVPAVLGSATDLEVGEAAIAIGSPHGLTGGPSVTAGVVSALGRRVDADGVVLHGMIQTDAPIARGSSGGALCDGDGVVVGITTALATSDGGPDGLAFAIPIEIARAVAEELLGGGDVRHARLGIEGTDLAATEASVPGIAGMGGVRVVDVQAAGPAAAAGIVAGDVVVRIGERRVAGMSDLVAVLRGYDPGDVVDVELRRAGELLTVTVTLGER